MPAKNKSSTPSGTAELTLMFYFASDNPLARGIESQLKILKQAGFHPDVNVIVHFDPNVADSGVHIFDVNRVNKIRAGGKPNIRRPLDAVILGSLIDDKLWGPHKTEILEQNPGDALHTFLDFCRKHYPARHYMLFILSHGQVMDSNLFLFDEHAEVKSLSLIELGAVLRRFKRNIAKQGAEFQLVSFHSCSMAALEVAYELQDTANYMLAAEGPAFVGSWPYAEILVSIFKRIDALGRLREGRAVRKGGRAGEDDDPRPTRIMRELMEAIWDRCYFNSYDFQLAGYSCDVSLCDLNRVRDATAPLRRLSAALLEGLADPVATERILLAHWDAQTYWQESYTDLYDFCYRLRKRCGDVEVRSSSIVQRLQESCDAAIRALTSGDKQLVIRSDFSGPAYQYSHGLFVYFPWSVPGNGSFWPDEYSRYKFNSTHWGRFLDRYFQATMRQPRGAEHHRNRGFKPDNDLYGILLEDRASPSIDHNAQSGSGEGGFMSRKEQRQSGSVLYNGAKASPQAAYWLPRGKSDPSDRTGGDVGAASIRNHASVTRRQEESERRTGERVIRKKRR